jgi:hypothetical protein
VKLFIEFDRQQLLFETNIDEARAYVASTFRSMLRPDANACVTGLRLWLADGRYTLTGEASHEYSGVALDELLLLIKDEVRLQFMRSRPDLLWMHAGAVDDGTGAILLAGASGQGKSTLTTHLSALGWGFLSDDVAPVSMTSNTVVPFPQTPFRRVKGHREVAAEELGSLQREIVEIPDAGVCRDAAAIRAIGFLEYRSGSSPSLERLARGDAALELLRNATNFFDHRAAAVERAIQLVTDIPMFRLSYSDGREAANLLISELAKRTI